MLYVKIFLAKLLSSPLSGSIIKFFLGNKLVKIDQAFIDHSAIGNKTRALLFWGFYESSERRFIKRHLRKDLPVIELGSSIGVIASIAGQYTNKQLVCVEANPDLISTIKKNLEINKVENVSLINAAIGYDSSEVYFERGDTNLEGKIVNYDNGDTELITTITLESVVNSNGLDKYVLICDIEGAEIQILKYDREILNKCAQIIIETHETAYKGVIYTSDDMKKLFLDYGFKLTDEYGPNFVFDRLN